MHNSKHKLTPQKHLDPLLTITYRQNNYYSRTQVTAQELVEVIPKTKLQLNTQVETCRVNMIQHTHA